MSELASDVFIIPYTSQPLHGETVLIKQYAKDLTPKSSLGRRKGRQEHPINMAAAGLMMFGVSTQQTCIQTKRDAIVGLGFETEADRKRKQMRAEVERASHSLAVGKPAVGSPAEQEKSVSKTDDAQGDEVSKVQTALDPLTVNGLHDLLLRCGEDYENTGNAYIEVIRGASGAVEGLHHMPSPVVNVYWEGGNFGDFHYEVDAINTESSSVQLKMARWSDVEGLKKRIPDLNQPRITELIHFQMPTAQNPSYGIPQWTAGIFFLELAQQALQMEYDFYQNRAVPDLMAFLLGRKLPKAVFDEFKEQLKQTIGAGKRFRTLAVNFPDPELKVQIERLQETTREKLADLWPTIELAIVSAHRVPPLLAGIVTPGKMAASNELPNALIAFQTLYVDQHQRVFESSLARTLGSKDAGLGLTPADFKLKKITDSYDMGQVDTMARMRETATEANSKGRDLKEGLKK